MPKKALFWKRLKKGIQCQLCPHYCFLNEGELGKCRARQNINGELKSLSYGMACTLSLDPIEKKPFYHFFPGEKSLSIATGGCNLSCKHCQNSEISQVRPDKIGHKLEPSKVIEKAKQNNIKIISYTYTESTIYYEYMLDIAKLAKKEGIKNTIVSNGFINQEPLKKLIPYLDAANIDIKALSDKHYKEVCGARLNPILETIKTLKKEGVWVELTNLLMPNLNDSKEDIEKLINWVEDNINKNTPIHFSAFYPCYKMKDKSPTPISKVQEAKEIAQKLGMKYVYTGNIPDRDGINTYCPKCQESIIERHGSNIKNQLDIEKGACKKCGEKIHGIWQ